MRMSCAVFVLTFVLGCVPLSAQIQGQWVSAGSMQSPREFNAQVRLATGKVLSVGGVDNSGNILNSAELYNPTPGTWALTGSMSQPREYFQAVLLKTGKVLVAGGLAAGTTVLAAAELYDPTTGTWSSAGSLSVARFGHTATLLANGKVLVTGGCTASACGYTAASELYDPTSNTWSSTGNLNTARYNHTAVLLRTGEVLAIGGSAGNSCELYNPSTGAWTDAASTSVARESNTTTLLADGKVLVTGGVVGGRYPQSSAEVYDRSTNTWTPAGSMTTGRYGHTATLLGDSTVLVAGGIGQSISCGKDCTGYIPTARVDVYDEGTGTFTAAASLSRALAYHSTTLLKTGRALTNGGEGTTAYCCVVVNTAQVYTPLTLTFSASSLNFGVLQIELTSSAQTVTVTNVSTHSVNFTSIASSNAEFLQSHTCPTTLAAGQNCMITVTFKPTAAGARNAAVTLKDNCPGSSSQTIALSGIGATNALTLLPNPLNFPGITPGTSSAMSITLYNDGASAVNLTSYGIVPADGTFTQTNSCPGTLNPNTNCVIQVVFTPPDSGNYSATLSVSDSDASSPQTASLAGIGLNN